MGKIKFKYNPERLIKEVRKRPGLWDYQDIQHRCKIAKSKLWNEVVTELLQPNIKVSKSEMRALEIQLIKKWTSIRDSYTKFVVQRATSIRPYIYSKQLQFLWRNYEVLRGKEDNDYSSGSDGSLNSNKIWNAKKKLKIVKEEEMSSGDEHFNFTETLDGSVNDSIEIDETSSYSTHKRSHNKVDKFVFANVDTQTKSDVENADKMFLLSLLPHLKTIPEESRLNVKMELMEVLRNANYNTRREYKLVR